MTASTMTDPVLSPRDVALLIGRDEKTVRRHLADPRSGLVGVKRGARWYIYRSAVHAFLRPGQP